VRISVVATRRARLSQKRITDRFADISRSAGASEDRNIAIRSAPNAPSPAEPIQMHTLSAKHSVRGHGDQRMRTAKQAKPVADTFLQARVAKRAFHGGACQHEPRA